jgi:DNA-binding transcriptional ArsR family regulator
MNDPIEPKQCADKLRALAAPERLCVIRALSNGPLNVGEISDAVGIPLVNLSHHLKVLSDAGFIRDDKQGRFVYYSLTPGFFEATDANGDKEHLNLGCCRLEVPPTPDE